MITGGGRHFPHFLKSGECALSLLSSSNNYTATWNIPASSHLPGRGSAALRELIAENRASIMACRGLISSDHIDSFNNACKLNGSVRGGSNSHGSNGGGGHVTLDLMRARNSAFGFLSESSSKEGDEEGRSELWKLPLGYSLD